MPSNYGQLFKLAFKNGGGVRAPVIFFQKSIKVGIFDKDCQIQVLLALYWFTFFLFSSPHFLLLFKLSWIFFCLWFILFYAIFHPHQMIFQVYFQHVLSSKSPRYSCTMSCASALGVIVVSIPPVVLGMVAKSTDWSSVGSVANTSFVDS